MLTQCETEKQIEVIVRRITARLGFACFLYTRQFTLDRARNLERVLSNFPPEAMLHLVRQNALLLKAPLTPRELECLKWIADGKSTSEVSRILGISEHGVQHHVRNTMDKFDVTSRHKAVARAMACGVI